MKDKDGTGEIERDQASVWKPLKQLGRESDWAGMPTLSIRQPWAWLITSRIFNKDVENRSQKTSFRGKFLIHASAQGTAKEYEEACAFAHEIAEGEIPSFEDIQKGGIVGQATVEDCTQSFDSPWFVGPHGLILSEASVLPFLPCKGALGFFKFKPELSE